MPYQRAIITAHGGPEVLDIVEEASLPEPGPGAARVRVLAASASFTDMLIRTGQYPGVRQKPPFTIGYDVVGRVDKLGPGVGGLAEGQMVANLTIIGGYTQYGVWPAGDLVPVPDGLDPAEAAAAVLTYTTAYQMLHRVARVPRGGRVLIHGASGGVGIALQQLGARHDLHMIGTASAAKHESIAHLGAQLIDYRREDVAACVRELAPDGVDAAFDAVGGASFRRSFSVLKRGGTLVAYGFTRQATGGGGSVPLSFLWVMLANLLPNGKRAAIYVIAERRTSKPDEFRADLEAVFKLIAEGAIRPAIAARLPLADVRRAHEMIDARTGAGRVVLLLE